MFGINFRKLNPLSRVAHQELVGIDFSGNTLKLVHVKGSSNKKVIVNLLNRDITGLPDEDVSKIIATTFNDLKAKKPSIINTMLSHLVITKNIEIPSVDPKEIKEIINLQAGRHTPYSRDEIIVDYIRIGAYKNSYTKILLVIVPRNVVKRQFSVLDKAGIKLERMFFAPEGLGRSMVKMLNVESDDSPISVLHIDEGFADFNIVLNNNVVFIRSIPIGVVNLTGEKEKYEMRFIEEVKRSLEVYQSENIEKSPSKLVLTGAIEELKDLEIMLNNSLDLPILGRPYLENLMVSDQALKAASGSKHLSYLNMIASLLPLEEMKVNLVPEEIKLNKSLQESGKDLIKTGILIMSSFILIFSVFASKIYFKSVYLQNLNTKYQTLDQEAQDLEIDFSKIRVIKKFLSNRGLSLEVLAELYNLVSKDLELSDIRFNVEKKFSIRGTAKSISTVFSFVDKMEKSKFFKKVKTKYTATKKEGNKELTEFEIIALLGRG